MDERIAIGKRALVAGVGIEPTTSGGRTSGALPLRYPASPNEIHETSQRTTVSLTLKSDTQGKPENRNVFVIRHTASVPDPFTRSWRVSDVAPKIPFESSVGELV